MSETLLYIGFQTVDDFEQKNVQIFYLYLAAQNNWLTQFGAKMYSIGVNPSVGFP